MNQSVVTAAKAPALTLKGISKHFGGVEALSGIDLELHAGEVTALVGDNGAGKSTLTKIISGIYSPDGGSIQVGGANTDFRGPRDAAEAGIQTVYQDLALCENLNTIENLFLGRELRNRGGASRFLAWELMEQEAIATLESLGVKIPNLQAPISFLSGGQRQGIAISRSVLTKPSIVLLDEPTAALGITQKNQVRRLLDKLRAQGLSLMVISHDMEDVKEIADRIVVLRLGRKIATFERGKYSSNQLIEAITGAGSDS